MAFKKMDTFLQNFKYNIKLSGVTRVHFTKSEWDNPDPMDMVSWGYLIYRALYLAFFLIVLVLTLTTTSLGINYYFIMCTNWSLIIQTIYGAIFFCNLAHRFYLFRMYMRMRRKEDVEVAESRARYQQPPNKLNIWDSITWLLMNITSTLPLVVTVGYWGFVYYPDGNNFGSMKFNNFAVHGINTVWALVDTLIIAIPVRMAHACYTLILCIAYLTFSGIYEAAGASYPEDKPYIYPFLNWREHPGWTVLVCFGCIFGAVLLHGGLWSLYKFRLYLAGRFRRNNIYFVKT